jgi:SAM-dependent methyltransferase
VTLPTMVCKYEDFFTDWYRQWAEALHQEPRAYDAHRPQRLLHRKLWEWNVISQALDETGMLAPGQKGCGFAVGREPLTSLFASRGAEILATDLPVEAETTSTLSASAWSSTGQHSTSLESLHEPSLISLADFNQKVRFKPVDMRNLNLPWDEDFDFLWSSCSIEHLGSLQAGMDFVKEAMGMLKPGGIAVHTTEFNVSSNDDTLAHGPFVIYRKKDIEQLDYDLRKIRCALGRCDFFAGDHLADIEFDKDPFGGTQKRIHIKLELGGHVATSLVIIIRKGAC